MLVVTASVVRTTGSQIADVLAGSGPAWILNIRLRESGGWVASNGLLEDRS